MDNKNVAILYIALGSYICFWKEFYDSFECRFLPEVKKDYYVFTDNSEYFDGCLENVHVIEWENLGWPGNTLYRFDMFLSIRELCSKMEYIFFFNSNYICNKNVDLENFAGLNAELMCVAHPGFYGQSNYYFTYDRNKESLAYVPYGEGECYVQGCFLGGRPKPFFEMCEKLSNNIHIDEKQGVMAEWHDESHVNKYIIGRDDVMILGPEYAYPEFATGMSENEIVLLLRDKEKYIKYKGKKNRSKYWFYCRRKRLIGMIREGMSNLMCYSIKR